MLEQMRRQGASIFIYFIFGLLIVIFVINFAPSRNRGGLEGGCSFSNNTVVSVDGKTANQSAYLIAYSSNGGSGHQKVQLALDELIRRELLAQAAEQRGIRASGDLADEEIKRGSFFLGGDRLDLSRMFFEEVDGEKFFSYKRFKGWVGQLNVSTGSYRDEQARGLQAAMQGQLISGSVRVSREEALANYLYDHNTVTYDVVAFDPGKYRTAMRLTEADINRFLDGHKPEVEARYKAEERTYKGVKPQLQVREIFIPKALPEPAKPADDKPAAPADAKADKSAAKPADDKAAKPADKKPDDKAAKPADKKPADKKPADDKAKADKVADKDKKPAAGDAPKPYGLPTDAAKAKLEALRASIASGKLTFPDAEKQVAADASEDAPNENGDRGWRSVESLGLGETALNDAAKALKPGEMTQVIVTDRGAYLVMVTGKREGDLSFDQVKAEIAADLAKDVWSKEAAKRDALDALAKAQSGGKPLEQMFERELAPAGGDQLQQILESPNLSPEDKRKLIEMLQQRHGSLELHEKDVPASWEAEDDPPGSAGSSTAPAGDPKADSKGSPAPAVGSAASGSGAAAGSAAAPAAAATPPPPAVPVVIEASKDVLPQLGSVAKAKVNRLGPFPRQAKMPGVGSSKEAIAAIFDELAPGTLAKKVYEGEGGGYVILQLINRQQPNVDEFDKMADDEIAKMQAARGKMAVRDWLKNRCDVLTKAGKIRPAAERVREYDDKGNPKPTTYRPCMYFDMLDR